MCPPRWLHASGCWAAAGRTRTTPTTRSRLRSQHCAAATCAPWSEPIMASCCGCWPSATSTSATSAPRVVCRLHNLLIDLRPGGIGQELYASHAQRFLDDVCATTPAEHTRLELAHELLADIRVLDDQLKASHRRIRPVVAASNTSVTDLYGIGPILACYLMGYTGDVTRFANRDAYAAYNGIAPVERSSGGRVLHRVSQRGNRKLNHALHLAAICQIRNPGTEGRVYFERKVAEGKTKKDAIRSLKRHVSNAVYRKLLDHHHRRVR